MSDLFENHVEKPQANPPTVSSTSDEPFWMTVARRKLGVGPEWEWCHIEAIDKRLISQGGRRDVLVEGAVPTVFFQSGPRKGKPNWKKIELQTVVVTQEEEDAEAAAFEATTGKCRECHGKGQTVASFGVGGTKYRECFKCKGTGASPARLPDDRPAGKSNAPLS